MASSASETFQGSAIRYFTDWIVDLLPTVVKVDDKDIIVTTTLDPQLQFLAESKLHQVMEEKGRAAQVSEMALVSMTHEGAIRALIGGANYVVVSAPGKGFDKTLAMAVNHYEFNPLEHHIISNASCTTKAVAVPLKALIDYGILIHSVIIARRVRLAKSFLNSIWRPSLLANSAILVFCRGSISRMARPFTVSRSGSLVINFLIKSSPSCPPSRATLGSWQIGCLEVMSVLGK